MKPSEYLFCPFGRKVALNVGYKEYQYTEQNHDLDHIIDEKLNTVAKQVLESNLQALELCLWPVSVSGIPWISF